MHDIQEAKSWFPGGGEHHGPWENTIMFAHLQQLITVVWAVSLVSEGFDNWPRMPANNHLLSPLLAPQLLTHSQLGSPIKATDPTKPCARTTTLSNSPPAVMTNFPQRTHLPRKLPHSLRESGFVEDPVSHQSSLVLRGGVVKGDLRLLNVLYRNTSNS